MIAANELRIGNLAYNQYGKIGTVWGFKVGDATHDFEHIVSFKELNVNSCYSRYIQPIPLTPEILEKCGFKKSLNGYCYGMITNDGKNRFSIFPDGTFKLGTQDLSVNIHHLHQLQNLYWCLTNSELTINL